MQFFKENITSASPVGTVIGFIDGQAIFKSKRQKRSNNFCHEYETGIVYVELTKGQYGIVPASEWFSWMRFMIWFCMESESMSGSKYMASSVKLANGKYKIVLAHKLLLNVQEDGRKGVVVHHEDENGLNNLPDNISIVSRAANAHNRKKANRNNKSTGELNIGMQINKKYRVNVTHDKVQYIWQGFSSIADAKKFRDQVLPTLKAGFSK